MLKIWNVNKADRVDEVDKVGESNRVDPVNGVYRVERGKTKKPQSISNGIDRYYRPYWFCNQQYHLYAAGLPGMENKAGGGFKFGYVVNCFCKYYRVADIWRRQGVVAGNYL